MSASFLASMAVRRADVASIEWIHFFGSPQHTIIPSTPIAWSRSWLDRQQQLNDAIRARFDAGAFPPNWRLFDWAALTNKLQPPTVVPHGDQQSSWHYSCQFYRRASWYTMANHTLAVMTQASGECGEGGSTPLWDALLSPTGA